MLGDYTWGDSHHPGFSETDGEYDGRWLFINDNAKGRIARIDLKGLQNQTDHEHSEHLGQPRQFLCHPELGVRDDGDPDVGAVPGGDLCRYHRVRDQVQGDRRRASRSIPNDGNLTLGWEVLVPPFNYDLGDAGKGPSDGFLFWTCYNSEREFIEGGKLR